MQIQSNWVRLEHGLTYPFEVRLLLPAAYQTESVLCPSVSIWIYSEQCEHGSTNHTEGQRPAATHQMLIALRGFKVKCTVLI